MRRKQDDSLVFQGKLSEPVDDPDTGDRVQGADFTSLEKSGTYYLQVPGVGRSWDFTIGPNVYERAFYLSLRAFYGQRCGTAVNLGPEFPGYKHAACHMVGAYHQSSGKKGPHESAKGWHDAGDYVYEPSGVSHDETKAVEDTTYLFIATGPILFFDENGFTRYTNWEVMEKFRAAHGAGAPRAEAAE